MTDCGEVLRKLELFLDGQLSDREGAEVEEHVAGCSPCLDRREFRVGLQRIIRQKCASVDVPSGLLGRIRSAIPRAD